MSFLVLGNPVISRNLIISTRTHVLIVPSLFGFIALHVLLHPGFLPRAIRICVRLGNLGRHPQWLKAHFPLIKVLVKMWLGRIIAFRGNSIMNVEMELFVVARIHQLGGFVKLLLGAEVTLDPWQGEVDDRWGEDKVQSKGLRGKRSSTRLWTGLQCDQLSRYPITRYQPT